MKTKTKQSLILLLIIIIEIVGFNNHLKYIFFSWINPGLSDFFRSYLIAFKILAIGIIIFSIAILFFKLKKTKNEPLFIVYLIKGFQVKGSDLVGVFNVVFTLCSISWIGIEIYYQTFNGFLNAVIYAGFMIFYPLLIANYILPTPLPKEQYHPKILITALSMIDANRLSKSLEEMDNENLKDKWLNQSFINTDGTIKKSGSLIWGPWGNLDPIRKSIIVHNAAFHEIVLILSNEVSENIDLLPKELKPEKLIVDFLNKFYPNHNIKVRSVSEGISGNDMNMNIYGIENILRSLFGRKYTNADILFNVTGGTAAISGAMILKAIPNDRRAEYARQDTGHIEEIPLDIYQVKELWEELLEKVG